MHCLHPAEKTSIFLIIHLIFYPNPKCIRKSRKIQSSVRQKEDDHGPVVKLGAGWREQKTSLISFFRTPAFLLVSLCVLTYLSPPARPLLPAWNLSHLHSPSAHLLFISPPSSAADGDFEEMQMRLTQSCWSGNVFTYRCVLLRGEQVNAVCVVWVYRHCEDMQDFVFKSLVGIFAVENSGQHLGSAETD